MKMALEEKIYKNLKDNNYEVNPLLKEKIESIGQVVGGLVATAGSVYASYILLNNSDPDLGFKDFIFGVAFITALPWIPPLILIGTLGAFAGGLAGKLSYFSANYLYKNVKRINKLVEK
jgi:hypothetical protein